MKKVHLIMPMAGAGSRFFDDGYIQPKPLITIEGKPFFYWAAMSILSYVEVEDITFAVLQKHIDENKIDVIIKEYFPNANIVIIPSLLKGPVLTCLEAIKNIHDDLPILFNDSDHMFKCSELNNDFNKEEFNYDSALLTFKSNSPQYSYLNIENNQVIGTVEKNVVSEFAICGAYIFRSASLFKEMSDEYLFKCNYSEYFTSGLYNIMIEKGFTVKNYKVDFHLSFGTPYEYKIAESSELFDVIGNK